MVNDLWDRDIDRRVVRTAGRPLASGMVRPRQALLFLAVLLLVGLAILLQLNALAQALGVASLLLVALYPLAKRVTWWPQLMMGFTFGFGAPLGYAAGSGRLDAACAQTSNSYTALTIRSQRTRWASCSHTGAMSFNWRLLLAPEPVLDYVVWHEVCHLDVLDHSPRFWALLERRCPDYREHLRWLRRHGGTLVL